MQTRPLLYGIIGFILGGLLVSIAATTFDKPASQSNAGMTMNEMAKSLQNKRGDDFDRAFVSEMIEHHQGAIDMATLAATRAKHPEIKKLSANIVTAQTAEIQQMKTWQQNWNYSSDSSMNMMEGTN